MPHEEMRIKLIARFCQALLIGWILVPFLAQAETTAGKTLEQPLAEVISADIEDAQRLSSVSIDVSESDGLITLSGTVRSVLDKQLAESIAKRSRGVKAVSNQIVIRLSDRSDSAIRQDVLKVLRLNDATDRPQIKVDVTAGEVSMVGKVDSLAEKRIAELAVGGVRGVVKVNNQLAVALTVDRPDVELQEELQALMVFSVYLDNVDVDVRVEDKIVYLSGSVRTVEQGEFAEQLAELPGIRRVDVSEMEVDPDSGDPSLRASRYANIDDNTIRNALRRVLMLDPIVFDVAGSIKIDVDNGVVTLTGKVDRLPEKAKAEDLASGVVGVGRINNALEVQPAANPPSDLEMIEETQQALLRSPYLNRRGIRVHCQRAHVSLYGVVESELEKQMAEWLAGNVTGAVHVNNWLTVESPWEPKPDSEIEDDLRRKLRYALVDAAQAIDVSVEDGVAVLSGEVDTWLQWQTAMDLALEAGARHPHNLLNVRLHSPHGASGVYVPR